MWTPRSPEQHNRKAEATAAAQIGEAGDIFVRNFDRNAVQAGEEGTETLEGIR
jgi:hypothetical protein